jgi:hypothetical protein
MLSNKLYDSLKWAAQIGLPALGTLYASLAVIWGFPFADEVVGTIVAIDFFLGVILGLSNRAYHRSGAKYDGELLVDTRDPSKDIYSLNLDEPLDKLSQSESITLKVETPPRLTDSQQ